MYLKIMKIMKILTILAILTSTIHAVQPSDLPWDMVSLSRTPKLFAPPKVFSDSYIKQLADKNIRPLWYEGEPFQGKPTRTFGWYGLPKNTDKSKSLPAMILVHGGGGTANHSWISYWTKRGYAAISLDTCGYLPVKGPKHIKNKKGRVLNLRTTYSGPKPYGFDTLDKPLKNQWAYHAVSSIILTNSLLRSFPEIDPDRIGIIGVSWGGYLTCLTAGIDHRLKFAISVYGCGFLHEDSTWADNDLKKLTPQKRAKWAHYWDPSSTLGNVKIPMLWVTGTNDFAYVLGSLQKSYQLVKTPVTIAIRLRMKHGHNGGWLPKENYVFADSFLKDTTPLAKVSQIKQNGRTACVKYESQLPIKKAELLYTKDSGKWQKRYWQTGPAKLNKTEKAVVAEIPEGITTYFINITDSRGCVVSSPHIEMSQKNK